MVLLSANHNPMLVERVNRYVTKGLKIMCNERDSIRVALEAILLLLYAWNSCPVPGTDISRRLVAVGREFAFPIDYSGGKHWELTSSTTTVVSYSKELGTRLSACQEVAKLLVEEQRSYHRELTNARRLTLMSIQSATSSLRDARLDRMPSEASSINSSMHLRDHCKSLPF